MLSPPGICTQSPRLENRQILGDGERVMLDGDASNPMVLKADLAVVAESVRVGCWGIDFRHWMRFCRISCIPQY